MPALPDLFFYNILWDWLNSFPGTQSQESAGPRLSSQPRTGPAGRGKGWNAPGLGSEEVKSSLSDSPSSLPTQGVCGRK